VEEDRGGWKDGRMEGRGRSEGGVREEGK